MNKQLDIFIRLFFIIIIKGCFGLVKKCYRINDGEIFAVKIIKYKGEE